MGKYFNHYSICIFIKALDSVSFAMLDKHLSITFFLGIAIGPMFCNILMAASSVAKMI